MNTRTTSRGSRFLSWRAPCQSMSNSTSLPAFIASSTGALGVA